MSHFQTLMTENMIEMWPRLMQIKNTDLYQSAVLRGSNDAASIIDCR